jgi:hypothetical protein
LATGPVNGASVGQAQVAIGGGSPAFVSSGQAVAIDTGAPNAASTSAVLSANPNISTAFGASPTFFAIEELGGAHASGGSGGSQTSKSTLILTVDLTQLSVRHDLRVGLYNPVSTGAGFTNLTLDLYADGTDVVHKAFTSVSAAKTYFTDDPLDLGSLATGPLSGNTLTVQAVLQVTTASAGSGFYAGLIIGDPPAGGGHGAASFDPVFQEAAAPDLLALQMGLAHQDYLML